MIQKDTESHDDVCLCYKLVLTGSTEVTLQGDIQMLNCDYFFFNSTTYHFSSVRVSMGNRGAPDVIPHLTRHHVQYN